MSSRQGRQRRRNRIQVLIAALIGLALFMLGVGVFEMCVLVLASYYAYWILKMD